MWAKENPYLLTKRKPDRACPRDRVFNPGLPGVQGAAGSRYTGTAFTSATACARFDFSTEINASCCSAESPGVARIPAISPAMASTDFCTSGMAKGSKFNQNETEGFKVTPREGVRMRGLQGTL